VRSYHEPNESEKQLFFSPQLLGVAICQQFKRVRTICTLQYSVAAILIQRAEYKWRATNSSTCTLSNGENRATFRWNR